MSKKILVTGFEPFGGETVNPSWEAVKLLPDVIGENELEKLELPVEFGVAADIAWKKALECRAEVILCVGQAGGQTAITPERVAINLRNGRCGERVCLDEPILPDAPTAYFTKLPIRKMVELLKAAKIPSKISYSAGTYVCNDTMYNLLQNAAKCGDEPMVGFVHVPFIPEQVKNGEFALPLESIAEALKIIISTL